MFYVTGTKFNHQPPGVLRNTLRAEPQPMFVGDLVPVQRTEGRVQMQSGAAATFDCDCVDQGLFSVFAGALI